MTERPSHHLHLISDSTGETLHAVSKAALAPFGGAEIALSISVFVRSVAELDAACERITENPGPVLYTLADPVLNARLLAHCQNSGVPALAPLDAAIDMLSAAFDIPADRRPGLQYQIDRDYFDRIAALDYAIAHDDGALGERLMQADVILTGVSRTSKTPTCIYLAHRGVKAANVPLVPGQSPDPAFFEAHDAGVPMIGLTASPGRLSQVRSHRLEAIGAGDKTADYAEIDRIRAEVAEARLLFERLDIPVIDVTRRSIEETAAAIMAELRDRADAP